MVLRLTKFAYLDPALAISEIEKAINDLEEGGVGVPEAPSDGTIYGRQDAAWVGIAGGGGGGIPDAPSDGVTYGRMNAGWNQALAHNNDILDGGNF